VNVVSSNAYDRRLYALLNPSKLTKVFFAAELFSCDATDAAAELAEGED